MNFKIKQEICSLWIELRSIGCIVKHKLRLLPLFVKAKSVELKWKLPLKITSWFNLDIWYATKILGWEFDAGFTGLPHDWHFHTRGGNVIKPSDYKWYRKGASVRDNESDRRRIVERRQADQNLEKLREAYLRQT